MRLPITDDQFSTLIEEHKGIIYKIANSYCRNAEDRKDLLFFGVDVLAHANAAFLWVNLAVSLIFVAPAVWVLRNLSFKNTDNPVIRALVHGNGGKQMIAALEFLQALQEFEDEEKNGTARPAASR